MFGTQSMDKTARQAGPWTHLARKGVLLVVGLTIVASVACGGSDDKKDTSSGSSSGSTPAASSTASSGSGSSSTTPSPTASSSSGGGSSSSSGASKLDVLSAYRYTVHMEGTGTGGPLAGMQDSLGALPGQSTPSANQAVTFDVTGAYVKPDKAQYTIKIGSLQVGQTVIGKQEWVTFGGTTTGPSPATSTSTADLSLVATIFDDDFSTNVASKTTCSSSKETVNGVSGKKCSLDKAGLAKQSTSFGGFFEDLSPNDLSKFQLDIWLADSGSYPVKLVMDLAGKDTTSKDFALKMEMNLTDINKTIDISPPK